MVISSQQRNHVSKFWLAKIAVSKNLKLSLILQSTIVVCWIKKLLHYECIFLMQYLSVVLDIRPFCPTPLLLSRTPEFVLSWQWDLCEPSMKRDPRSPPFWYCLASTMTCLNHSACEMHLFCSRYIFPSHLSILFHHSSRWSLSQWAQMSKIPPLLRLAPHNLVVRRACLFQPTFFLVLMGSPTLLLSVLLFCPSRVDLLVPPTEQKEGIRVILWLWHV